MLQQYRKFLRLAKLSGDKSVLLEVRNSFRSKKSEQNTVQIKKDIAFGASQLRALETMLLNASVLSLPSSNIVKVSGSLSAKKTTGFSTVGCDRVSGSAVSPPEVSTSVDEIGRVGAGWPWQN